MENKEQETLFGKLSAINVNERVDKKGGLSYLSWSWAWSEFKTMCPDATYQVYKDENNLPYVYDDKTGYMVYVAVTACGEKHEMWLPVMDGANKAMKANDYTYTVRSGEKTVSAATMFDINKTIMRCLVKCLAMFGLGIYIYSGEDLPEVEQEAEKEAARKKAIEDELQKFKAASISRIMKYEVEIIQIAFNEIGCISELEDKEKMVCDLIKQVPSKEQLINAGLKCGELSKAKA